MGPRRSQMAGVEVDECPPHGVWFDHDELVRVSETVSRLRGAAPSPAQRAFAQWGPPVAAGAAGAALGAAALGAAAGANDDDRAYAHVGDVIEVAAHGVELTAETGAAAVEIAGGAVEVAGENAGGVFEVASGAVELAGGVLEGVLSVVGGIFEGL